MLGIEETEQLFRQQAEKMHRLAATMLHDEEEARDAVSEIFERLSNGAIRLPQEKPESYLYVCLRNLCLDQIRRLSLAVASLRVCEANSRSRSLKNLSDITNFLKKHPCGICVLQGANSHGFFYIKNLTAKNGSQRSSL